MLALRGVPVMFSAVPNDGIMRQTRVRGWGYDLVNIFEVTWKLIKNLARRVAQQIIGKEHRKAICCSIVHVASTCPNSRGHLCILLSRI